MNKRKWNLLGLLALCTLTILVSFGHSQESDPYQKGLEIIKQKGTVEGIRYFKDLTISEDNAKSLYYMGWAFWRDGDSESAREIAEFCLENIQPQSFLAGHCYYLLGNIQKKIMVLEESETYFQQAIDIYTDHKKTGSLFKAQCALASLYIHDKRFEEAKSILAQAMVAHTSNTATRMEKGKTPISLGYYYELYSRIAFAQGEYRNALGLSTLSLLEYRSQGDERRSTHALSTVGFFKIITGQVKEGLLDTQTVQDRIDDSEDYQELSYYNGINYLIAARCAKKNFTYLRNDIAQYIKDTKDVYLEEVLEFAMTWNCGKTNL